MNRLLAFISLICLLVLTGCQGNEEPDVIHAKRNEMEMAKLEKLLQTNDDIERSHAVFFDHQLIVGVEVQPLKKWNKKQIEQKLQKQVEKAFPKHDVFVSSDLKISWELKKLTEDRNPDPQKYEKELKRIRALAKEET